MSGKQCGQWDVVRESARMWGSVAVCVVAKGAALFRAYSYYNRTGGNERRRRATHQHCCRVSSKTGSRHDSLDYIYIYAPAACRACWSRCKEVHSPPARTETQASQGRTAPTHRQTREVGRCRPTRQRNPRNAKNNVWRRFKRRDRKDRSRSHGHSRPHPIQGQGGSGGGWLWS